MSRLGKQPITIPKGVEITIAPRVIKLKGPKGEFTQPLPGQVVVEQQADQLVVRLTKPEDRSSKALWGLARQLVANAVTGVSEGFSKQLEIQGVGYRAQVDGDKVVLNVGYSHPVNYKIPAGITIKVEKNIITVQGISKQQVGQVAAELRAIKIPEPYKGKGIKYVGEVVRRKAGKLAKAATGPGAK
ncbi:MAG: 50S ribosomal protein L6 [Patescibacteria group bacterium]